MPVDAPTTERGHQGVNRTGFGLSLYMASLEDVVDLTWPTAVRVYDRMRRTDSKVAASIRAMFLPIMAANWHLDPRGADDDVVLALSDDLGLPVAGAEDELPPRRTRDRFDWGFHLRHALLSRVFGFMPFEQVYRIDGQGMARIRKLAPRMPHTLTPRGIKVAEDGGLEGIEQQPPSGRVAGRASGPVFIPVDRLVVHVHDREGANWHGTSILRPVYRDFLLKDTYHRIAAIGIDRHGAGVPIYTDSPDAEDPQKEAAAGQALAEGYRVGENAGGRIPAGASFELKGVDGQLPDILAYVRYHDEQIAANTLEMFSTLPSAPNGSRALGDSLVDFFTMALNGHATDIATVETNHVVEDWVDLNFGPDAAAPAIVCGAIGADQEPTAAALRMLLQTGAVKPDAALERYLRRTFRLPAPDLPDDGDENSPAPRTPDEIATLVDAAGALVRSGYDPEQALELVGLDPIEHLGLLPVTVQAPDAPGGASAKDRGTPRASVGERPARAKRDLHPHEIAAQVDFEQLDAQWTDTTDTLVDQWLEVRQQWTDEIITQVEDATSVEDIAAVTVTVGAGAAILHAMMMSTARQAADEAAAEAARQGVDLDVPDLDVDDRFAARARTVEQLLADSLRTSATGRALTVAGDDFDPDTVAAAVRDHLEGLTDAQLRDQLGGAVTAAQNAGRLAVMGQADGDMYASEILDGSTCANCATVDGHEFGGELEARESYPTGGYRDCLGGPRCRGTLVKVYDEAAPTVE